VFVAFDHSSLEAVLEQVTDSPVAAVEPHRVEAVEPVHPGREIRLSRLYQHVDVVVEQAPSVDHPVEPLCDVEEQREPAGPVLVVVDDRPLLDPAANTVVIGRAGQLGTPSSAHPSTLARPLARRNRPEGTIEGQSLDRP
jgi:hypothetical protein